MGDFGQESSNEGRGHVFIGQGYGWWSGPPGTDRKQVYGRTQVYDRKLVLAVNMVIFREMKVFRVIFGFSTRIEL